MNLLVAGHDRVDAGKTTFSTGLLSKLDATGFKPRAGNDYWFDHGDYRRAVESGRLYGKDAKRLAAASSADVEPEAINPVHRLWRPDASTGPGILGPGDRSFVVDRVGAEFVVNARADVPDSAREHLPLADATTVSSLEELNDVMERRHVPALRDLAATIAETPTAVVESYSDVALPIRGVPFAAVAVVGPERASIYDGARYAKACEVASGRVTDGRLEQRTRDVTDLLDPVTTASLPALTSAERSDAAAVGRAYEPAYDSLLSVARAQ